MRYLALLVLVLFAAACSSSGEDATSRVRFIHAAPGADSLDVFIDGNAVFEVVRIGTVTPYATDIAADEQPVRVRSSTEALELLRFAVELIPDGRQSIIAAGVRRELRAIVLDDALLPPRPDSAQVRIVHAAALSDSVAASLVQPEQADTAAIYPRLRFRQNTGYFYVPPGTYRLRVSPIGGAVAFDETIILEAGEAVTLVLADASETGGITLIRADG